MTLLLQTESHGEVESGFYAAFTQFVRLGEHTFATKHLCELVEHLARNPSVKDSQMLCYNLDMFFEREGEHIEKVAQLIYEASNSYVPELKKFDMTSQLEREQGEISIEDDIDMYNRGRPVPVVINNDKSITLGDYTISALHFGRYAAYIAQGGFMGWINGQNPDFADSALDAIKTSKRELFRDIKEELKPDPSLN